MPQLVRFYEPRKHLWRQYEAVLARVAPGSAWFRGVAGGVEEARFLRELATVGVSPEDLLLTETLSVRRRELSIVPFVYLSLREGRAHDVVVEFEAGGPGCRCEAGRTQVSKLRMDFSLVSKLDIMETSRPIRLIIVSARMKVALERMGARGVSFVPCLDLARRHEPTDLSIASRVEVPDNWPYFQLLVEHRVTPPMVQRIRDDSPICGCGRVGGSSWVAARYSPESMKGFDFGVVDSVKLSDNAVFGIRLPTWLVSSSVIRMIQREKMTGIRKYIRGERPSNLVEQLSLVANGMFHGQAVRHRVPSSPSGRCTP